MGRAGVVVVWGLWGGWRGGRWPDFGVGGLVERRHFVPCGFLWGCLTTGFRRVATESRRVRGSGGRGID